MQILCKAYLRLCRGFALLVKDDNKEIKENGEISNIQSCLLLFLSPSHFLAHPLVSFPYFRLIADNKKRETVKVFS